VLLGGTLGLHNSTVSGNSSGYGGGVYQESGDVSVSSSTITSNDASFQIGGIRVSGPGVVSLLNTIVAVNSDGNCRSLGLVTSLGNNIDSDGSCNLIMATDLPNTDPLLGPLQDNGGPTLTHALLEGSPAIDAANTTASPLEDQRGIERPQGADSDIGAFELVQTVFVEIDIKPGSDPNCFNNDGHGVIPVAVFGSEVFDVSLIDPGTVTLESLVVNVVGKKEKFLVHLDDVNSDGIVDLVLQIADVDGQFENGNGIATLTGSLFDGTEIEGSDEICVVQ
jgi:hypothetical protein